MYDPRLLIQEGYLLLHSFNDFSLSVSTIAEGDKLHHEKKLVPYFCADTVDSHAGDDAGGMRRGHRWYG